MRASKFCCALYHLLLCCTVSTFLWTFPISMEMSNEQQLCVLPMCFAAAVCLSSLHHLLSTSSVPLFWSSIFGNVDLIFGKVDLIFGKGRSHFWKRKISVLEKEDLISGNVASIVGNEFSFLEMLLP